MIAYNEEFETFWYEYPRKRGKKYAHDCWHRATKKESEETILEALRNQCAAGMLLKNHQYTPFPATWLNQERWEDDVEAADGLSESAENANRLIERIQGSDSREDSSAATPRLGIPEDDLF